MLKSLHLSTFDTGFEDDSINFVYVGDNVVIDPSNSFYVHQFQFQGIFNVTNVDGVDADYSKAIRGFDILTINDYDETIIEAKGDLPDEKKS